MGYNNIFGYGCWPDQCNRGEYYPERRPHPHRRYYHNLGPYSPYRPYPPPRRGRYFD